MCSTFNKYIAIDSTYRDRTRFPLPSQMDLNTACIQKPFPVSAVSNQIQRYPSISPLGESQLQLEPISFYYDQQTATTVEQYYYPYLFRVTEDSGNGTEVLLDPLVLASVDVNNPDSVQTSIDYPEGYVPLERADNAIIGQLLTNITTGETRLIISSQYYDQTLTLQQVVISNVIINEGSTFIVLDEQIQNSRPLSDINNFYVGKYITVDGTSYLINGSYLDAGGEHILKLNQVIPIPSTIPLNGSITASEYWIAQIESPFSTPLPSYPGTLSSSQFINYNLYNVDTQTFFIRDLDIVRQDNDFLGVAQIVGSQIYYIISTDTAGTTWNAPINISPLQLYRNTIQNGDLAIISSNPSYVVVEISGAIYFKRATASDGTTWPGGFTNLVDTAVSFTNVYLCPAGYDTDFDGGPPAWDNSATFGFPIIAFRDNGTNALTLARSSDADGTAWDATFNFGVFAGTPFDIAQGVWSPYAFNFTTINEVTSTHVLANSDGGDLVVLSYNHYQDTTTTPLHTIASSTAKEAVFLTIHFTASVSLFAGTSTGPIQVNYVIYILNSEPENIYMVQTYIPAGSYQEDLLSSSGGVAIPVLIYSGTAPQSISGVHVYDTSSPPFYDLFIGTSINENLEVTFIDDNLLKKVLINTQELNPVIIDLGISNTDRAESILNHEDNTSHIVYVSNNTTIFSLSASETTLVSAQQYYLSANSPSQCGQNNIISHDETQIQLPISVSSNVVGNYFFIKTIPSSPTPAPSDVHIFNDYRIITAVDDSNSQIITIESDLSADIDTAFAQGNNYEWCILGEITDYYSPLSATTKTGVLSEPVCYHIRLQSLTLPNITLSTGNGNRIAFYPYVYVEFSSNTVRPSTILFTNSPVARRSKALFLVPITNIVSPDRATFVNLSGGGMVHNITITPNDNFRFSVYLPNGDLFQTLEQETNIPDFPNPNIQISAVFNMKRVENSCYRENQ